MVDDRRRTAVRASNFERAAGAWRHASYFNRPPPASASCGVESADRIDVQIESPRAPRRLHLGDRLLLGHPMLARKSARHFFQLARAGVAQRNPWMVVQVAADSGRVERRRDTNNAKFRWIADT